MSSPADQRLAGLDVDCGAVRVLVRPKQSEDEEGVVCADRGEEIDKQGIDQNERMQCFWLGTVVYVHDDVAFPLTISHTCRPHRTHYQSVPCVQTSHARVQLSVMHKCESECMPR